MNVLLDIFEWSQNRPIWQRDALRRLVQGGDLSDEDINSLTAICKSAHGLADQQEINTLAKEHIPDVAAGTTPVADITSDDCKAVEVGMTKCSTWLTGHDQAAAARAPVPKPEELKADIDTLAKWVKAIRDRRK